MNVADRDALGHPGPITVTVPARAEFLHVIRAVVGSVAARRDLTIDAIEDLRIAVDEACSQLIGARGTTISVQISHDERGVDVLCRTDATGATWPPDGVERTLAAQVLRGLADDVAWEHADGSPAVRVGKRAAGATPSP